MLLSSGFLLLLLLHWLKLTILPKNGKIAIFFVRNIHQIRAKPIAFQQNFPENSHEIGHFLPIIFLVKFAQKIAMNFHKISGFFQGFASENPIKFDFFP